MSFVGKKIRDSQANTFNYVYEGAFVIYYASTLKHYWNYQKPKRIDDLHPYVLNHTALSNQRQPTRLIV